jgi:hypothetical protein
MDQIKKTHTQKKKSKKLEQREGSVTSDGCRNKESEIQKINVEGI